MDGTLQLDVLLLGLIYASASRAAVACPGPMSVCPLTADCSVNAML